MNIQEVIVVIGIPEEVEKALVSLCPSYPWIKRIAIFGFRARGDADERSDIDLAIEAPSIPSRDWLNLYFAIEDIDTLLKIDPIRMEEVSDELKKEIASEGVTLFERSKVETKSY